MDIAHVYLLFLDVCAERLPATYPLEEVHQGLVWTTILNYLRFVMPSKCYFVTVTTGANKRKTAPHKSVQL